MNPKFKHIAIWLVIVAVSILVIQTFVVEHKDYVEINYSNFIKKAQRGDVKEVTIKGQKIKGQYITDEGELQYFKTYAPDDDEMVGILRENDVKIKAEEVNDNIWLTTLVSWFPLLLFIGIWIFFLRQMQGGGKSALAFGKSRARLSSHSQKRVTFADVAGIEEAKEELQEIVEFLKDTMKFQKLGGKIPKGVLLTGPPGTGKTLLARAIAGEAAVPFFSISGSDFVEMFVGVGASRVRDLFEQGKKNAPCLIFMDEIDAVGRQRGAGLGGGHDEREQTLNQLLVEMDGFESNEGVILIAATNRPDILDPALLRPGRFDRQVVVNRPDVRGRVGILKVHTRNIPISEDVDLSILARGTPGFSGADLENLVNEAALIAARDDGDAVAMSHMEQAKDKVLMGMEHRSMVLSEEDKKRIAYHEAGHALVAWLLPEADPIHKVTIIPRGRALGVTQLLPLDDKYIYQKESIIGEICVKLGGRVAELLIFNQISTGAGDDLKRATKIARHMVCNWGMSDKLGPLTYGSEDDQVFLGRELAHRNEYSEKTAQTIDEEIHRIVMECFKRVEKLLQTHIDQLQILANALLEKESLDHSDLSRMLDGLEKSSAN